jgi:hypothetical protein
MNHLVEAGPPLHVYTFTRLYVYTYAKPLRGRPARLPYKNQAVDLGSARRSGDALKIKKPVLKKMYSLPQHIYPAPQLETNIFIEGYGVDLEDKRSLMTKFSHRCIRAVKFALIFSTFAIFIQRLINL